MISTTIDVFFEVVFIGPLKYMCPHKEPGSNGIEA